MEYWAKREAESLQRITDFGINNTQKKLAQYYSSTIKNLIAKIINVYDEALEQIGEGGTPALSTLYKMDKYWALQSELQKALEKLGNKQEALLEKNFLEQYSQIYEGTRIKDNLYFRKADIDAGYQVIKQIWCADGKAWSDRVWDNMTKLRITLNESLMDCIVTGKKTSDAKKILIERFGVSYNQADTIVRTEMAHIQTEATKQRYSDYGIEEVEVLVDKDERTCPICKKLIGKKFPLYGQMPVPAHPRCRCCIVPVIKKENIK